MRTLLLRSKDNEGGRWGLGRTVLPRRSLSEIHDGSLSQMRRPRSDASRQTPKVSALRIHRWPSDAHTKRHPGNGCNPGGKGRGHGGEPTMSGLDDLDYKKLMDLALWLDLHDAKRGRTGEDEVQRDLRRIARRLIGLERGPPP